MTPRPRPPPLTVAAAVLGTMIFHRTSTPCRWRTSRLSRPLLPALAPLRLWRWTNRSFFVKAGCCYFVWCDASAAPTLEMVLSSPSHDGLLDDFASVVTKTSGIYLYWGAVAVSRGRSVLPCDLMIFVDRAGIGHGVTHGAYRSVQRSIREGSGGSANAGGGMARKQHLDD